MNTKPWQKHNVPQSMQGRVVYPFLQWMRPSHLRPLPASEEKAVLFISNEKGGHSLKLTNARDGTYRRRDAGKFIELPLTIVPLAWRKRWYVGSGAEKRRSKGREPGAYSVLTLLALLKDETGAYEGPAVIYIRGTSNSEVGRGLMAMSSLATSVQGQLWMFECRLDSGPEEAAGADGSTRFPAQLIIPSAEDLESAYIGDETVERILGLESKITSWRGIGDDDGDEVDETGDDGANAGDPDAARLMGHRVKTQAHGSTTIGELLDGDPETGRRVIDYLANNSEGDIASLAAQYLETH